MRVAIVLGLLALVTCQASGEPGHPIVKTTAADVSSVAQYATYTYVNAENAPEGYAGPSVRPDVLTEVQRDVDAELQARGYRPAEDGELVVRISTGRRRIEQERAGRASMMGMPPEEETEGALVIDIFERASGRQVFHGFARQVIHDGKVDSAHIRKAVSKTLERVPQSARTSKT